MDFGDEHLLWLVKIDRRDGHILFCLIPHRVCIVYPEELLITLTNQSDDASSIVTAL